MPPLLQQHLVNGRGIRVIRLVVLEEWRVKGQATASGRYT
jgi:hypothetical protein